jgi:hypothetical protein
MRLARTIGAFLSCAAILATAAEGQERTVAREIGRTTERELNVVLSSSFGSVTVYRGEQEKMLVIETEQTGNDVPTSLDYAIRNRIGYADITLGERRKDDEEREKKRSFNLKNFNKGKWYLKLSDAVPVSFDIELGVGAGDFNLTGLQVKDFTLSAGASNVTLAFDEPNRTRIDNITIESGVTKFDGRNLGNANFRHLRFQGGMGAYSLDFGGMPNNEVDVDIEIGLGVLTVYVPREIGARVSYDKSWMSRIDCDEDFHESGTNDYLSDNYQDAAGKMNIRIDSGLGSIKIRRR